MIYSFCNFEIQSCGYSRIELMVDGCYLLFYRILMARNFSFTPTYWGFPHGGFPNDIRPTALSLQHIGGFSNDTRRTDHRGQYRSPITIIHNNKVNSYRLVKQIRTWFQGWVVSTTNQKWVPLDMTIPLNWHKIFTLLPRFYSFTYNFTYSNLSFSIKNHNLLICVS